MLVTYDGAGNKVYTYILSGAGNILRHSRFGNRPEVVTKRAEHEAVKRLLEGISPRKVVTMRNLDMVLSIVNGYPLRDEHIIG